MGICKRISAEKKSASASARTRNLANYITTPELANGQEKCVWSGSKGFLSNTHEGRIAEMISLAGESKHSKDPLDHWMISLHDDEKFSREQAEEAVDIFLQHTGLEGHQVIWGVHDDTKNRHIHISVNRVNPETLLVAKINKGFNKEAGQQVIALIEHAQGWKSEKGARYTIIDGVPVMTAEASKTKFERMAGGSKKPMKPRQRMQDMELQTGTKSAQRIGIEDAAPIITAARNWRELHDGLSAIGMRYERKGSGAVIFVGDRPIKASDVSRSASLSSLQKRLGQFTAPITEVPCITPAIGHLTQSQLNKGVEHVLKSGFDRGIPPDHIIRANADRERRELEGLAADRASGLYELSDGGLDAQGRDAGMLLQDTLHEGMGNQQTGQDQNMRRAGTGETGGRSGHGRTDTAERAGRDRANQGLWTSERRQQAGKGANGRNAVPLKPNQPGWDEYQTLKAERKAAKAGATTDLQNRQQAQRDALFEKQKAERSELFTRSWRGQGALRNAMLSIIATRHAAEKLELREQQQAERQAVREQFRPLPQYKVWKERPQIVSHVDQIEVKPVQQPQLAALLRSLRQIPCQGGFNYKAGDVAIFRDEGKTITVLDHQSSQSIAAALAHAQQRFGQMLTLTGTHDFQVRAVRAAVAHGLSVKFKDPLLEEMRLKLIEEKRQAERAAQAERTVAVERESERAQPSTIQPAAQQRPEQEDQMATQEQRELAQAATDEKKANPQYQPSLEALRAVDAVLIERVQDQLKSQQTAPVKTPEPNFSGDSDLSLADLRKQIDAHCAASKKDSGKPIELASGAEFEQFQGDVIAKNREFYAVSENNKLSIHRLEDTAATSNSKLKGEAAIEVGNFVRGRYKAKNANSKDAGNYALVDVTEMRVEYQKQSSRERGINA